MRRTKLLTLRGPASHAKVHIEGHGRIRGSKHEPINSHNPARAWRCQIGECPRRAEWCCSKQRSLYFGNLVPSQFPHLTFNSIALASTLVSLYQPPPAPHQHIHPTPPFIAKPGHPRKALVAAPCKTGRESLPKLAETGLNRERERGGRRKRFRILLFFPSIHFPVNEHFPTSISQSLRSSPRQLNRPPLPLTTPRHGEAPAGSQRRPTRRRAAAVRPRSQRSAPQTEAARSRGGVAGCDDAGDIARREGKGCRTAAPPGVLRRAHRRPAQERANGTPGSRKTRYAYRTPPQ